MSDVQEELSLSDYIRLLRRHAGKVVIGALVGAAAGLAFGLSAAPRYRASCHVLIEEQRPRVTEMEDLYAVNVSRDFYETQYRLIRSKPVMAAAARKLDLGRQEGPFKGMSDARIGEAILRGISVNPDGNSRLVWISYEGHDQKQAVLIANAAVQAYQESTDARHKERIDRDLAVKRDELPRLREMLREAEQKRQKFQEANAIVSADRTYQIMMDRLAARSKAMTNAEDERLQAERELNQVRAAGETVEQLLSLPFIASNDQMLALKREKLRVEQHRIDLLEVKGLGKKHPEVLADDAKLKDIDRHISEHARELGKIVENTHQASLIRERQVSALLKQQKEEALKLRNVLSTYEALCAEVENIRELYDPRVRLLNEAGASLPRTTTAIHIIQPAEQATAVSRSLGMKVILGGLLGLLVAIGLAALVEFLDDSVKSFDDLTQFAKIPVLSIIPHIKEEAAEGRRGKDLICELHPKSAASESFRSLRTSLTLSSPQNGCATYLVTSAVPTEGKTTVAVNTAIVMAHSERKVIVVDADLRRFGVHKSFELDNDVGLTDHLAGDAPLDEVIRRTGIENLDVITSGPNRPNPSELLDSAGMDAVVKELRNRYDVVIIDSPPLIAVADPLILAQKVDGVLQIVHGNKTSRKAVRRAKELLESVNAPILGAVLNNIDVQRNGYYYGYYRSRYYKGYYHY